MKNKKNRLKNYLKLGIFLFGIAFLLQNCEKEEINFTIPVDAKFDIKTVSVEGAKNHFLDYQKSKSERVTSFLSRESTEELILTPLWETTVQDSLSNSDALMTNTQTLVNRSNRRGNYITKLFFIEVNDSIISGLHTEYIDNRFEDGSIKDGRIYFNDLEGKFLDAYRITEGVISYRMNYEQQQIQQVSFLSFLLLLQTSTISEDDCWNTDNLPDGGGWLDEVVLSGGGGGGYTGYENSDGSDIATYWLYTNNEDDNPNNNYQYYYGSSGNTTTTTVPCTGGKIRNATTNECECPDEKIEDSSGNCIDACPNGKVLNANDNCVCPENQTEDENGICRAKTPCERMQTQLNSLPFSISLNDLKTKTSLHQETGYIQNSDGTFTLVTDVSNNGHSLALPDLSNVKGYLHTHQNDFLNGKFHPNGEPVEIQPYRMFSPGDVIIFLKMLKNANSNNIPVPEMYATMVSSTGTYMLRFTGNTATIPEISTFNRETLNENYKELMKYYRNDRAFLKLLKHKMGINGIHLYKIKNNGVIKEKKLKSNERVESITCE